MILSMKNLLTALAFLVTLSFSASAEPASAGSDEPYCVAISTRMDLFSKSAGAGINTMELVAAMLEEKATALRRARSREVLINRWEAIDFFSTLSRSLRAGENLLAGTGEIASYYVAQVTGDDSLCVRARRSSKAFKYVPDAFKAGQRTSSVIAGILDHQVSNLYNLRSNEALLDAYESANTFSSLAYSLRTTASTLQAAKEVIDEVREKLKPAML